MKKTHLIIVLLILLVAVSIYAGYLHKENSSLNKKAQVAKANEFELLSPSIAFLNVDDFLAKQQTLTVSYSELKPAVNRTLTQNADGRFALYFEDLESGAWLGINEREKFIPASLLKMPTLVAVLKKVQGGDITLDQKVSLQQEDLDLRSGTLGLKGAGYEISIRELLVEMLKESDNTAFFTFNRRILSEQDVVEARLAMGLPPPTNQMTLLSPKEYMNIFRALYFSTYLRRPFSELALSMLLETDFNSQIPAGLPKDVKVSHKVGMWRDGSYFHDCGIIYLQNKDYMLCIMSMNTTQVESDRVMQETSKVIYDYMAKK